MLVQVGGAFIGAVLLWDILFRGQIGFSMSFLEEMWSRNLGNLMMTPLRTGELIAALMVMSIVRVLIGMVPVTFMAIAFFGFNFWALGLAAAAFFGNLILTSWSIGLVASGMVLKQGARRRGAVLEHDLPAAAALLRLLSGRHPAGLAAMDRAGAPADPCLRRAAGIASRRQSSMRPPC